MAILLTEGYANAPTELLNFYLKIAKYIVFPERDETVTYSISLKKD
jgi:hypothetical protein